MTVSDALKALYLGVLISASLPTGCTVGPKYRPLDMFVLLPGAILRFFCCRCRLLLGNLARVEGIVR
jgi:hypothetical protein